MGDFQGFLSCSQIVPYRCFTARFRTWSPAVNPYTANDFPDKKRNFLLGIFSLHTAATAVLREIWPSAASSNLCTFAGVTHLLHMTSGKEKALAGKCVSDTT